MSTKARATKGEQEVQNDSGRCLPTLRKPGEELIAMAMADLHLSVRAPRARAKEDDWVVCMAEALGQVRALQETFSKPDKPVPILVAGDLFDRWNSPAELINFALAHLPDNIYAIPGQHDLPFHSLDLMHKSAYWTLVAAGKIKDLSVCCPPGLVVQGFPYGCPPTSISTGGKEQEGKFKIAVLHDYLWINDRSYEGAPQEKHLGKEHAENLAGYDFAVYGDNHKGFVITHAGVVYINCGSLMRRRKDEEIERPCVYLLTNKKRALRCPLDITKDVLDTKVEELSESGAGFDDLLEDFAKLETHHLDFFAALRMFLEQNSPDAQVQQILAEATDNG